MTFIEIVQEVADHLNLTSDDAMNRIGRRVNKRYKWVTSAIGVDTSKRIINDFTVDNSDPDTELPDYLVLACEKVTKIQLITEEDGDIIRTLDHVLFSELTEENTFNSLPTMWADKRMGSQSCTIRFDNFYDGQPFYIRVEGLEITDTLSDDAEPAFPESFHDILVEGAISDELRKMEKNDKAKEAEARYEQRLSDLRMFIAKSAWKDIMQAKYKPRYPWLRNRLTSEP